MRLRWLVILAVSSLPLWGADAVVGSIKTVQGGGVVRRGAEVLPVAQGMHLLLEDVIQTPADGRLGLILQDGTRISLGPNSELQVRQFVYQPAQGKCSLLLRLARGVMAYVSGKIAQFAGDSVSVETPVAVLGLRGTYCAVRIEQK